MQRNDSDGWGWEETDWDTQNDETEASIKCHLASTEQLKSSGDTEVFKLHNSHQSTDLRGTEPMKRPPIKTKIVETSGWEDSDWGNFEDDGEVDDIAKVSRVQTAVAENLEKTSASPAPQENENGWSDCGTGFAKSEQLAPKDTALLDTMEGKLNRESVEAVASNICPHMNEGARVKDAYSAMTKAEDDDGWGDADWDDAEENKEPVTTLEGSSPGTHHITKNQAQEEAPMRSFSDKDHDRKPMENDGRQYPEPAIGDDVGWGDTDWGAGDDDGQEAVSIDETSPQENHPAEKNTRVVSEDHRILEADNEHLKSPLAAADHDDDGWGDADWGAGEEEESTSIVKKDNQPSNDSRGQESAQERRNGSAEDWGSDLGAQEEKANAATAHEESGTFGGGWLSSKAFQLADGFNSFVDTLGQAEPTQPAQPEKPQTSGWGLGLSSLSHVVSSTMVHGGVDMLAKLGEKTISALHEKDPGFAKTKSLLEPALGGHRQNFVEVLREAKSESERQARLEKEAKQRLRGDFNYQLEQSKALIHLEAIELVSSQAENQLHLLLQQADSDSSRQTHSPDSALLQEAIARGPILADLRKILSTGSSADSLTQSDEESDSVTPPPPPDEMDLIEKVEQITRPFDNIFPTRSFLKKLHASPTKLDEQDASKDECFYRCLESLVSVTSAFLEYLHKFGECVLLKPKGEEHGDAPPDHCFRSMAVSLFNFVQTIHSINCSICAKTRRQLDNDREYWPTLTKHCGSAHSILTDSVKLMEPILQLALVHHLLNKMKL